MGILGADLTYEFEKIGVAIFEAGPVCLGPRMAHAGRILVALRVQWSGPLDPGSWVDSKIMAEMIEGLKKQQAQVERRTILLLVTF